MAAAVRLVDAGAAAAAAVALDLVLVLAPLLPPIREGDSSEVAAAWALAFAAAAAAAASWLLLLLLLPFVRSNPAGLPLGDNDPVDAGGLNPNRLTPFAVGGFILEGVRVTGRCAGAGAAAAAGPREGAGPPPLLSAGVRGDRAASTPLCCCFPAGVPEVEPTERRLPSHSFSLSCDARRGLRRVPCLESNILRLGGSMQTASPSGVLSWFFPVGSTFSPARARPTGLP